MYDPDCAAPTPMRFHLNSLADTRFKLNGCSAGQMCSLSGTCVSTFNGAAVPQAGANAVSQATAFVNTAGNSAFDIPPAPKPWKEILTLTAPPTSDHRIGAKAHTSFQQGHAESSVFYQSKIELARVSEMSLLACYHSILTNLHISPCVEHGKIGRVLFALPARTPLQVKPGGEIRISARVTGKFEMCLMNLVARSLFP